MRGEDVLIPYSGLTLRSGDSLLLATTSNCRLEARIEEVTLESGHEWIGRRIKELDISRQTFIVMVKRRGRRVAPNGSTLLKENDVVLTFSRIALNSLHNGA